MIVRWRVLRAVAFGLAALTGVLAGIAGADATVTYSVDRTLTITVVARSGADGDHGLIVQRFGENGGIRVKQIAFGDPAITSPSPQCTTNPVFNDVVCDNPVAAMTITLGDGEDEIRFERKEGSVDFCATSVGSLPVSLDLGAGDDVLTVLDPESDQCPLIGPFPTDEMTPRFVSVAGRSGNDDLLGGLFNDVLGGGPGNDTISAGNGNDSLQGAQGNDVLEGGSGNDTLAGGTDIDTLRGEGGNDLFQVDDTQGTDGADTYTGGGGFDTLNYGPRTVPLEITIGNAASPDGAADERDNVVDVEQVIGGSADDRIVGSGADEVLLGNNGRDSLTGGDGEDTLRGGSGDDTLSAVDGEPDTVDCGSDFDRATVDLQDTLSGCELVLRLPADDSPPGRPAGGSVVVSGAAAVVTFVCPRSARPRCAGSLSVRDPRSGRLLGRSSYAFALGRRGAVRVPLSAAEVRLLRGRGRVLVETIERGHSQIGPRGVSYLLRVRR